MAALARLRMHVHRALGLRCGIKTLEQKGVSVILSDENEVELGPFEFVPDWRSLISGLGGAEQGTDPHYVFHTPYADFGQDEVLVTLRFEGLAVTQGMIVLRVNAYPKRPGSLAYQAAYSEVPLRLIALDGGTTTVRFRPAASTLYAILGHVYDETDASATGLAIAARRMSAAETEAEARSDARRTSFGAEGIRQVPQLMTSAVPTLLAPISQACSRAQFGEPVYAEWAAQMHETPAQDWRQWRHVFILQTLRRYGLLEAGARAIGFGPDAGPLPALLAATGCQVTMADPDVAGVDVWRNPALCPDPTFAANVVHRPANRAELSPDLAGFDMLWSQPGPSDLTTVRETSDFIHRALDCIKPGGLAVHMVMYDPQPGIENDVAGNPLLRRADLDRLALTLIGHGHEIAQFAYPRTDSDATAFGIITRRGLRT